MGFAAAHTANLPNAASTTSSGAPFTNTANLLYIAFAFGISLVINIWIFFRVSGGIFNPAVAFALALAGAISPLRAVLVSVAQIVGGITAAALIDGLMPGPLNVATTLGENTSIVQGTNSFQRLMFMKRFILGDVSHCSTDYDDFHARSRKTQINFPRPSVNRLHTLRMPSRWDTLHWSKSQPSKKFWSPCCPRPIPWLPLDLLYAHLITISC